MPQARIPPLHSAKYESGWGPLPEAPGFFAAPLAQAITEVGHAAADSLARAIIRGILDAESAYGLTAYRDLPRR